MLPHPGRLSSAPNRQASHRLRLRAWILAISSREISSQSPGLSRLESPSSYPGKQRRRGTSCTSFRAAGW